MIHAECHSDDHVVEVKFDATAWFEKATDEEIKALAACDWGGDYPGDAVAEWMAEHDASVKALFDYLALRPKEPLGFECHVDATDALAWIKANRPSLGQWIET